ncbi:phosphoribosylglycinamide formyltransferase [Oceanobacillus alkalisoli]|uniref:phosphoribosylglycinamide formyltransferase n=1 Tax=Oceanobacillus alkalisoli TaxID=2925113 RepID=UPI001EF117AE|nr:phosphoribosylglycinamide formyltransferase [Oceanobacillus alkalisoli]MCF3942999.1 phosphoribosylglycinamide formyltransferase [Oceanobacillus alkalisoli]MCG5104165.1 phosphoribosylglycinamide formyltransferase [Oceanobacillus alkalisoli]
MSKVKAAVFASGTGSNFQAMLDEDDFPCEIVLLVSDQEQAGVLKKAMQHGIETFVFSAKDYESKEAYEAEIAEQLKRKGIEWVFLAGYMRLIGPTLLQAYEGKIVNIHPSYLPAFPGKDAIGQAFEAGVRQTGVTVHFIDEGMDTGPIIRQEAVSILANDTKETLQKRIQKVEHRLYPQVIRELIQK